MLRCGHVVEQIPRGLPSCGRPSWSAAGGHGPGVPPLLRPQPSSGTSVLSQLRVRWAETQLWVGGVPAGALADLGPLAHSGRGQNSLPGGQGTQLAATIPGCSFPHLRASNGGSGPSEARTLPSLLTSLAHASSTLFHFSGLRGQTRSPCAPIIQDNLPSSRLLSLITSAESLLLCESRTRRSQD